MKNKELILIRCPVCLVGKIEAPKSGRETDGRRIVVRVLAKAGFGVREIQRLVGYGSPNSVSEILKRKR